jgi:hypothetical protein
METQPPAGMLNGQSFTSGGHFGPVGCDVGKLIKGCENHLVARPLGLVLSFAATPAGTTGRHGGKAVLGRMLFWLALLCRLWDEGGYTGAFFFKWVMALHDNLTVELAKHSDDMLGLRMLQRFWVVERTLDWLMFQRPFLCDYESTIS